MRVTKLAKLSRLLITLAIGIGILTACDQHEEYAATAKTDSINPNNCITIKKLQEFNENFVPSEDTRGWKFTLAEVLAVAISDYSGACSGAKLGGTIGALVGPNGAVVGATVGGAICGAAQSYASYKMAEAIRDFRPYSNSDFKILSQKSYEASYLIGNATIKQQDYKYGNALGLDSCSVKIGILHNKILDTVESIETEVEQDSYILNMDPVEKNIVYDIEFQKEYDRVSHNPRFVADPNSAMDTIMSLFIQAVNNKVNSFLDLDIIIKHYVITIKQSSDLTQIEKDALLAGMSVMKYSVMHWASKYSSQLIP